MNLQGRAIYNLIRLNWLEDPTIPAEPWQVEDLRQVPDAQLFKRLKDFKIDLNKNSFTQYAKSVSSPEELAETLWIAEEEDERYDQAYLLIFELWRRLFPQQQSLSIFCDELDRLFYLYDQNKLGNEEALQTALGDLDGLLDKNVDQGGNPQEIFAEVCNYCSHDLESFIYDYAADLIERGQTLYASELIDGFAGYASEAKWFEFLRAALIFETDEDESMVCFERLFEHLQEEPQLDLLLEMARFLVKRGNPKLFLRAIQEARPLIETEQDFQELLALTCDFSRLLDKEKTSKTLQRMLSERQDKQLDNALVHTDQSIGHFYSLLSDF